MIRHIVVVLCSIFIASGCGCITVQAPEGSKAPLPDSNKCTSCIQVCQPVAPGIILCEGECKPEASDCKLHEARDKQKPVSVAPEAPSVNKGPGRIRTL